MSASAKNDKAAGAIKQLGADIFSADIFYAKVRNITSEENIASDTLQSSDENRTSNKNFASPINTPDKENITGYHGDASDNDVASYKNMPDKKNLTSDKNLTAYSLRGDQTNDNSHENSVSAKNSAGNENVISYKNNASENNIADEVFMARKTMPVMKNSLPDSETSNENMGSNENMPTKNSLAIINSPPLASRNLEDINQPESRSDAVLSRIAASEKNITGSRTIMLNNNLKSSSCNTDLRTTTTKTKNTLDNLDNIAANKILAGKENIAEHKKIVTRKNIPIENYQSPLTEMAASLGMASLGMLLTLRHVLPPEGGLIRVNAFARSISMSANNVRLQLENLQTKGLILTSTGGQEGRWVSFSDEFFKLQTNLFRDSDISMSSKENIASNDILVSDKKMPSLRFSHSFTYPVRCKEFYFSCLKINKTPEDFQPTVFQEWVEVAEQKSPEYAIAIILEFMSAAKTNVSAYLHTIINKQVAPSPASLEAAKYLLEASSEIRKEIGNEILPKDWLQAAGKLGLRAKSGNIDDLTKQQTAIMDRLEKFTTQLT